MKLSSSYILLCLAIVALSTVTFATDTSESISITDGASIQRAIDSRPGEVISLPPGDYEISAPIVISHHNSGLAGTGRIIQTDPEQAILIVSRANGVQLRDFVLTRSQGTDGSYSGLVANSCNNLAIDNVQVMDNRAASSAINVDRCVNGRITNCLVRNYSRISIDDRTASPNYGFAFKCFDGTGIQVTGCQGMILQANRVEELKNRATKESQETFGLGRFTKKNAEKGLLISEEAWKSERFPQFHQGSGIHIGEPEVSDRILLIGNYIENAAQGIDIHADRVTVSQNIVDNAAVGVKAMHGSRNTLIIGNQFSRCCAHAILLQPGSASHAAGDPVNATSNPESSPANHDGGSIIANNIISDFGYGDSHWVWGNERDVISLEPGQTPQNPSLADVIVQGNVVFDPGRDKIIVDGHPQLEAPRYRYALMISHGASDVKMPIRVKVFNNMFHPGSIGAANIDLSTHEFGSVTRH